MREQDAVKRGAQRKLAPIDYLRIGKAIGKMGYCGECCGCLVYRDFCDWAMELKEAEVAGQCGPFYR